MKKYTSLLLALLLACGTMIACEKDEPSETSALVTEASETEASDSQVQTQDDTREGFALRGQKYRYNNNDILILEVENTTDTHSSAAVTVTFYNEAGEAVKTQKKTFSQFPAGYKQSVLFQPQCSFDSYTLELSLEEYTGEVYISTFCPGRTIEIEKKEMPLPPYTDMTRYPTLIAKFPICFGPCTNLPEQYGLSVSGDIVLFDNTGTIYGIFSQWSEIYPNIDSKTSGTIDFEILHSKDPDWKFPDELTGELTAIMFPEFRLIQLP